MIVGWMTLFTIVCTAATDSTAPAAPKEWPTIDFVALIGTR